MATGVSVTSIGNEITVTEVPDGYNVTTGKTEKVSVTQGNETVHIAKVNLVEGGALTIKVVDEVTGNPVSDAKVEVTQPDGNKKTYKTNSDGEITEYLKVVKDKNGKDVYIAPVGEYSIKIVSVPDGATVTVGKESTVEVSLGKKSEHIVKINTSNASNTNPSNTNASNTNPSNTNASNTNASSTNTSSNTGTSNSTSSSSSSISSGTGTVESTNLSNNKDTSTTTTITSIDTKGTGGNNSTVKSQKTGESKLPYILFASIMLMIIVGAILYVKLHKEDDLEDIRL